MVAAISQVLGNLPAGLRDELTKEFAKITENYRQEHWEATELDGGRFCEIVYTILEGYTNNGNYPPQASKPTQFKQACESLASRGAYPKSARLTVPRILVGLYDIRNQRGVGHVGGDVDANHMDAAFVLHATQWVMAELVRIFHNTDIPTATATVEALTQRAIPLIWQVGNVTRVLDHAMPLGDQTLLLLYAVPEKLDNRTLAANLDQEKISNYKRVLVRLHDQRMIEYNRNTGAVIISPLGVKYVEETLLPKASGS